MDVKPVNIYFCGMIGSGKTTIGEGLAKALQLDFYDLDREMDRTLGHSFHKLVEEQGWVAFRELEYSICKGFAQLNNAIVGLGGGTVRYAWNMDVLRGSGLIILLTASTDELIRRVKPADRPRVNAGTTLEEDIRIMWQKHKDTYYNAADIVYQTDRKSIETEMMELKQVVLDHFKRSRP